MNNDLFLNGFVVQGKCIDWIKNKSPYEGAALRESWPLDGNDDSLSQEMTEATKKWFPMWYKKNRDSIWVCPEVDFVNAYYNYLKDLKIDSRVIMCASNRNFPRVDKVSHIDNLNMEYEILGWDNISASFDYSSIVDDLIFNPPDKLKSYTNMLNSHGLFDNVETINEYIVTRKKLLEKGVQLEECDCCKVLLYLIKEGSLMEDKVIKS